MGRRDEFDGGTEINLTGAEPRVGKMLNQYWTHADWKGFTARHPDIVVDDAKERVSRRLQKAQARTPGTEEHSAAQGAKQTRYAQRRAGRKGGL